MKSKFEIKHYIKIFMLNREPVKYEIKIKETSKIKLPKTTYGFYYFDLKTQTLFDDKGLNTGIVFESEELRKTPMTYIGKFIPKNELSQDLRAKMFNNSMGIVKIESGQEFEVKVGERVREFDQIKTSGVFEELY